MTAPRPHEQKSRRNLQREETLYVKDEGGERSAMADGKKKKDGGFLPGKRGETWP